MAVSFLGGLLSKIYPDAVRSGLYKGCRPLESYKGGVRPANLLLFA